MRVAVKDFIVDGGLVCVVLAFVLNLVGCTILSMALPSRAQAQASIIEDDPDPWEAFNRKTANFNSRIDTLFVAPAAKVYTDMTPALIRTGVSNFFFNVGSLSSAANNLLQGNIRFATEGLLRVGVNTTFGLYGLIDLASELKIDRHKADFGQTLGKWGVPAGPYLVLPLLGPTTVRDAVASTVLPKDTVTAQIHDVRTRNTLYFLRTLEQRSNLFRATKVLDEAALDPYSFVRDVFLQVRQAEVEGDPVD